MNGAHARVSTLKALETCWRRLKHSRFGGKPRGQRSAFAPERRAEVRATHRSVIPRMVNNDVKNVDLSDDVGLTISVTYENLETVTYIFIVVLKLIAPPRRGCRRTRLDEHGPCLCSRTASTSGCAKYQLVQPSTRKIARYVETAIPRDPKHLYLSHLRPGRRWEGRLLMVW